ncbi:hypothetical protein M885DRAFT_571389 [Pelagophyceae sp. CCMP2097]|nr:hypothetical protein M885DRAFT_571389 [Pelagophyceae sp. CCMP2097]|mmetsp:Transcript_13481/g.46935  ORF Transcript_13481/g.46935 Transcript_13481/m.46935 type:complete len:191 (-) Transcript_13481:41-613(-)
MAPARACRRGVLLVAAVLFALAPACAFAPARRSAAGLLRAGSAPSRGRALQAEDRRGRAEPRVGASIDEVMAAADAAAAVAAANEEGFNMLRSDAARFRKTQTFVEPPRTAMESVVTTLGTILSVNFVVIFVLFLWFLFGCFSLSVLSDDTTIVLVKAAFDPFILPLLSTHMGLTFLSAGLEKMTGKNNA